MGSNYKVSDEDYASLICSQFEKTNGPFSVYTLVIGINHSEKYLRMDQVIKGHKNLISQISEAHNEVLVMYLKYIEVRIGPHVFWKNKSAVKDEEQEESLLDHRTDSTNAFDK